MSLRYTGAWLQDGAFNPLTAPTGTPTYYPYLYSWGSGAGGALGLGNTTGYLSPKQVGSLSDWSSIASTARYSTFVIKNNGTLWAWGSNYQGALGLGNTTDYSSPKQVGALTNWLQLSCGRYHTIAIKTDGTIWSWGYGANYGQLGLGNLTSYSSPKQIGALTNWLRVASGAYSNLAVKTDGTLWVWGNGGNGQLGFNNTTSYSSPKQLGSLTNWLYVAAGAYNSFATKTDGTIWAWGYSGYGQLGLGNTTAYSSPKQIGALTNWNKVVTTSTATTNTTASLKTDGSIWAWGYNAYGAVGNSSTYNTSSPIQVGSLTTWTTLGAGGRHFIATRSNNTLWAWGYNGAGQLGQSNVTNYSSPKQVGSLTTWLNATGGYNTTFALQY